jgi:DNA-binding transcriptional regulator YdaS (Cro superfamily)
MISLVTMTGIQNDMLREDGLEAAIEAAGGLRALARLLGITHQAILQWQERDKVPADRILDIERVTGVGRERLRPDLYRVRFR